MTTKKQLCLLLFVLVPSSKFLVLPALYANLAAQDMWVAGLLNCLADGLLTAVLLGVLYKFKGESFYDILTRNFGTAVAKIVYVLYFFYFMFKAVVPVLEQKDYTETVLYETAPSVLTFLPFFFVAFYLSVKGFRTMGRLGEIIAWLTAAGLALVLFLSVGSADPYLMLPLFKNPLKRTLSAFYSGFVWYGQPIIILFMMGGLKKEKGTAKAVAITFAAASAVTVVIFALVRAIYGDLAVRQVHAVTKMTKYAIALSNVGRFDYIATLLLNFGSVLSLAVPLIFATECLKKAFGSLLSWPFALAANGIVLAATVAVYPYIETAIELFAKYFTPFVMIFAYVIPFITLLLRRKPDAVYKE